MALFLHLDDAAKLTNSSVSLGARGHGTFAAEVTQVLVGIWREPPVF
jgi:hypothetical protein